MGFACSSPPFGPFSSLSLSSLEVCVSPSRCPFALPSHHPFDNPLLQVSLALYLYFPARYVFSAFPPSRIRIVFFRASPRMLYHVFPPPRRVTLASRFSVFPSFRSQPFLIPIRPHGCGQRDGGMPVTQLPFLFYEERALSCFPPIIFFVPLIVHTDTPFFPSRCR